MKTNSVFLGDSIEVAVSGKVEVNNESYLILIEPFDESKKVALYPESEIDRKENHGKYMAWSDCDEGSYSFTHGGKTYQDAVTKAKEIARNIW